MLPFIPSSLAPLLTGSRLHAATYLLTGIPPRHYNSPPPLCFVWSPTHLRSPSCVQTSLLLQHYRHIPTQVAPHSTPRVFLGYSFNHGVVERKNKTLITLARTMIDEYNTPERFWAEAINTTCYTSNRLFPHRLLEKTPYELLNGKKPDVSFFRVFGCKCYIYKKHHHLGKFQRRCDIGFLLGYS
jgi:hypothetical protein